MEHSQFSVGLEFFMSGGRWKCTDVGTRTVSAIKFEPGGDASWYRGPPFPVPERVLDVYDFPACSLTEDGVEPEVVAMAQRRRAEDRLRLEKESPPVPMISLDVKGTCDCGRRIEAFVGLRRGGQAPLSCPCGLSGAIIVQPTKVSV